MTIAPVAAAVAARRRRLIRKFEEARADCPERARTLAELGISDTHIASRLMRSGVLVATGGERYFLSAEGLARSERRRIVYVLIALSASVTLVLALWFFLR